MKAKAVAKGLLRQEDVARLSDKEAFHLICLPRLSTVEIVTNISGRGVGMDAVKTHIEKIGGALELASIKGRGTTIKIRIPLTLAIIPGQERLSAIRHPAGQSGRIGPSEGTDR